MPAVRGPLSEMQLVSIGAAPPPEWPPLWPEESASPKMSETWRFFAGLPPPRAAEPERGAATCRPAFRARSICAVQPAAASPAASSHIGREPVRQPSRGCR